MYSFETNIRFSEVDETARLSIPAVVDLLQDCSTFHSESLGVGPAHAAAVGRAWMISGWEIEVLGRPRFNDRVRVSTWATGFGGIRATRDFTICALDGPAAGAPLVRATSNWFMFDARLGKPIRLPQEEVAPYAPDFGDAPLGMPPIPRHIPADGPGEPASPVAVTGAHLDTNHHVNNAQYVSLALGALEELELAKKYLSADDDGGGASPALWIDVRYSLAAKLGDTVYPHVHDTDGEDVTTVSLDNAGGRPFALVRLRRRVNGMRA